MDNKINDILETFPFLSYGKFLDDDYIGIIQNTDNNITSMYVLGLIRDDTKRQAFLTLGDEWWWGSNRKVPINIFFKEYFPYFREYLRHFSTKDFELVGGPTVSLQEALNRRTRRKHIVLKDLSSKNKK